MVDKQHLRVLVVDDSPETCALASRFLQNAGVDVVETVEDLDQVVGTVASTEPDVVVLDLAWPGGSALAALAEIKSRFQGCAVVVFSGYDAPENVRDAASLGADRFVGKGKGYEVLVQAVLAVGPEPGC